MRGITRTLGAIFAASALAAPVWAGVVAGEPGANLIASFDGNSNLSVTSGQSQWFTGWGSETPGASNYITTKFGQGFQVASGVHPWVNLGAKSVFTCALYADISGAPAGAVLAAFGTANNHIALVKSATDTVQVWQGGAAVSGLSVTSSALSVGYHLLVFGNDTAGALLSVDGATPVTTSTALTTPAGGFQLGAVYAGMGSHDWSHAYGMKVDELRGYDTKLTTAQIETLADRFPPPTLYTADLSSATTATYSTLSWSPSGTPAAYDAVEFIAASTGTTLTMDGATPILSNLAVSGGTLIVERGAALDAETAAISAGSTVIQANADLSGLKTSLGSVTVAADKTLTTGEGTTLTNLTFGSATAKVKVTGSTELSAIPYGMQSKTGTVEIVPQVNVTDEKWSFNTAQTLTYSANVNAPRLVVGDSGSANATITQVGGTISLSSTATACDSTTDSAILLGHWNTTTTYNLQAGTLSAPNGALCLGWDGTTTLNVGAATGNAALVNVYALKSGDRYREAAVTVNPTGTLQVGAGGIALGSHSAKSVTLAGGTLLATADASANISHTNGLNVTAPSTVAAAPSTTLTINKVSGASNLTLGTAGQTGTVVISDVSAYTGTATATTGTLDLHGATFGETLPTFAVASGAALILPAGTEGAITVPDGAALTLVLSSVQRVSGYATTVTSGTVTFKKVAEDGTLAEITAEDGTIENGTFTPSLNIWTATEATDGNYLWSNTANWSKGTVPVAGDSVCISASGETTLTLTEAATVAALSVTGTGTLTIAGAKLTVTNGAILSANVTLASDTLAAGSVQIEAEKTLTVTTLASVGDIVNNGTLVVDGGSESLTYANTISGSGSLTKRGAGNLLLSASAGNTYSGGTRIEAGRIGFANGSSLGSGEITLVPAASSTAGLWHWTENNVELANTINFGGEGTCQLYIPYSRTLSVGGTVGGSGTVELTHGDTMGTGKLLFKNTAVLACTESSVAWKIRTGMNLQWGNNGSTTVDAGTTERIIGSSVTVDEGGQLTFHPGTATQKNNNTTDKYIFATPITLNGGTLYTNDGSYVISSLYVPVASTVKTNWGKGIVFKQFFGDGDLRVQAEAQPQAPYYVFQWPYNNATANPPADAIWFTGKLTIASLVSNSDITEVYPDTESAFQKAYLYFETADKCALRVGGNRKIGALGGAAAAVTNSGSQVRTVTITGAYTVEESETIAAFAGSVGGNLSLALAENAAFELSGTLGAVADDVATFDQTLTLNAGSELKLQSTVAQTITAAITGDGALTIGDGTNASAVTLSAANTYAGGTTVKAGANLVLNGTAEDTAVLKENKTVSVEQDGTLTLTKGIGYITVDGAGDVVVDGTFTFGRSGSFANALTAPVTVNADATLLIRAWTGYALTVPALTVNGTLKNDGWSGATAATLTIPATGTLSGTGTIEMVTTFEAGATLDVTNGALTVSEAVTCAGTVTVAGVTTETGTILTCSNPADVAEKFTGAPEGYVFSVNEAGTAVVLTAKPTIEIPKVDDVALSAESQAVLLAKAEEAGLSEVRAVTGSTTVNGAATQLTAAQIDNALAVFGDSIVTADGTTLKVNYNFGIVAVEPYYYRGTLTAFLVKVKAETGTGDAATLTSGVTINLVDGESGVVINDLYGIGFGAPDSNGVYAAYFTSDATVADRLIGRSFKVKASK